jgi:hypothetical protein
MITGYVADGTITATTGGVDIPVIANLKAGENWYLVRCWNAGTSIRAMLCAPGATADVNVGETASASGEVVQLGPYSRAMLSANPKAITASSTTEIRYTIYTVVGP